MGQYGEILDAQKGLISQKLPDCTNGIWTVKMFVFEGKSLPPFLIMKDDGEVWQLATGEANVCWKCGQWPVAPPRPQPQPITMAISSAILMAAKSSLKETQILAASSSVKFGKVVTAPVSKA